MQIDGSCSSADVAAERHKSEQLAVNLAVNQPLHCEDAAAAVWVKLPESSTSAGQPNADVVQDLDP